MKTADNNPIQLKDRHFRLLELLPQNNYNITKSAIQAGFTESTATKQQKSLITTALKKQRAYENRRITDNDVTSKEIKTILADSIGISRTEAVKQYKSLIEQTRDLNVKLKALTPIMASLGLDVSENKQAISPTLNVTIREANNPARVTSNPAHIPSKTNDAQYTLCDIANENPTRIVGSVNPTREASGEFDADTKKLNGGDGLEPKKK